MNETLDAKPRICIAYDSSRADMREIVQVMRPCRVCLTRREYFKIDGNRASPCFGKVRPFRYVLETE